MTETRCCYHCGLALGPKIYHVTINTISQPMCCLGCQAVAETIIQSGLADYYNFRDNNAITQQDKLQLDKLDLKQFDSSEIIAEFLIFETEDPELKKTMLSIDGITCAACIWLLEKKLARIKGVLNFTVNLTTHRALLTWDNRQVSLSSILLAINKIGYCAQPYHASQEEIILKKQQRSTLKRLAISGLGFGQVMMFSAPLYGWFTHGIPSEYRDFFRLVSLVVTTPVLFYCGLPYFKDAWRNLKARFLSMSVSVSLALITVFIAGCYATISQSGEVYFDSITMFLFSLTLSNYLELRAREQAHRVIRNLSQQQHTWVTRISGDNPEFIPLNRLEVNDIILVKAGMTIPVDGVVIKGTSTVSEALLTGESKPKLKSPDDTVIAGSQNIDHPLTLQATKVGENTTLAKIIHLHERAQFDRPKIISWSNQVAHYFVIGLIAIALIAFGGWAIISWSKAFWVMISVLVISCPCALALATPVALTACNSAFAKHGFLSTRAHVIDALTKTSDIIFDKTGTLTEGQFTLSAVKLLNSVTENTAIEIAAALEFQSEHPISSAFKHISVYNKAQDVIIHPNCGVEGIVDGRRYYLGNKNFISAKIANAIPDFEVPSHHTHIILANQQQALAVFILEDKTRLHAKKVITALKKQNYRIHMLSGDNKDVVEHYAHQLGIVNFLGELSPQAKLEHVKTLQQKGAIVTMIGDGINDAPVLMQAQLSIAMGNAADITRISSDAVLLQPDLQVLLAIIKHAKKTRAIILENIIWALGYNLVTLPLAVSGSVAPYVAAITMSTSSIVVVSNALRLLKI